MSKKKKFDFTKDEWVVKSPFLPGKMITQRIDLLLKASGMYMHPDDVALDVHEVVKRYTHLTRLYGTIRDENGVGDRGLLLVYLYKEQVDHHIHRKKVTVLTKKQLERELTKYINKKIKDEALT